MLSEIAHKLDYAIKKANEPAPAPAPPPAAEAGGLDPGMLGALAQLVAAPSQEDAHAALIEAAALATRAERGFLMMIEDGRKLRFKAGYNMDQSTLQKESVHSRTIIKQVVQGGDPVLIADTSQVADGSGSLSGLRMRSILCVPLYFGVAQGQGQVGGVVYLDCRSLIRTFDGRALDAVQGVCRLAVSALEGATARAQTERLGPDAGKVQRNFERLLDVGRTVSSTLVLNELLELVIEKVLEVSMADRGFLMLIDEGETEPKFKIGLTWNKKDGPARRKRKLDESQFHYSTTVTKKAIETKESVVLQDVMAGGGDDPSVSMMTMELNAVMVAPLVEKGNVLGLIYVDSKMSNREFGESDLELFEALAGQAAIGLKNAILYTAVADQQRMESELSIAADMQSDLCPETEPDIRGIELAGYMEPAREVGGDYYDYVEDTDLPGEQVAMIVGDVSGKGLGAGMVAVMARCFLRSMIAAYGMTDPSTLLGYLNTTLCGELKPGKFMTMLLMVWNSQTNTVHYASSGHENIIVWRVATRSAEAFNAGGTPLGISVTRGGPTENATLTLERGDVLVTYTDGVTEAMNEASDEYTLERLVDLVNKLDGASPKVIRDEIMKDIVVHRQTREQTDDITMVILKRV